LKPHVGRRKKGKNKMMNGVEKKTCIPISFYNFDAKVVEENVLIYNVLF
jgi:hypothetical protein